MDNWNNFGNNRGRGFNRGGGGGRPFWRGNRGGFRGGNRQYSDVRGGNRPYDARGSNRPYNNARGGQGHNRPSNQPWQNRPRRDGPGKRLSEVDIGVTEYISDHEGFNGIIKSRYSDFQVSEINLDGVVAKLTDITPPSPPADEEVEEDEELLLNKYNPEILPMDIWDRINKLAVSTSDELPVEVDATTMSKEQRTKVHDAVKKAFGDAIVSSTINVEDKKLFRFDKYRKGVRIDNRVKWVWPAEYVYFIVHKENCDTMEAATRIAERLRLNIKPSMLGYAGTKDRRAKTSQWFSLRKVDPRKIAAACRELRDIRIGNFSFSKLNLTLGMLKGNQFRIALRNVTASDELVSLACERLREQGFLNYYGLQRFGSRADRPTYDIGLKLLQGKFQEAIDGILEEREGPLQNALRAYKQAGAVAALKIWPNKNFHSALEVRLLRALASCPTDLLGALNKLARNTRLLYLHSYQSLVWNRCVSERVRRFGLKPYAGDIVPSDKEVDEELLKLEVEECAEVEDDTESRDPDAQNGDQNKMADAKTEQLQNSLETSVKQPKKTISVKVLTQEDVDSGKYSFFDVIMPLPGHVVEYPPNMKEYYEELLKKDGLGLKMRHKVKSYGLCGAYRHLAVRPGDVAWRCVRYSAPHADLQASDWDELQGTELDGLIEDGKYKALLLTFTLPASCYATMALRELLKVDTSSDHQASQNNYHVEQTVKNESKQEKKEEEEVKVEVKEEIASGEEKCVGEKRKIEDDVKVEAKKLKQEVE